MSHSIELNQFRNASDIKSLIPMNPIKFNEDEIKNYSKMQEDGLYPTLNTFASLKKEYESYCKFKKYVTEVDEKLVKLNNGSGCICIGPNESATLYWETFPDNLYQILEPLVEIRPWNQQLLELFVEICQYLYKEFGNKLVLNETIVNQLFKGDWIYMGKDAIPFHLKKSNGQADGQADDQDVDDQDIDDQEMDDQNGPDEPHSQDDPDDVAIGPEDVIDRNSVDHHDVAKNKALWSIIETIPKMLYQNSKEEKKEDQEDEKEDQKNKLWHWSKPFLDKWYDLTHGWTNASAIKRLLIDMSKYLLNDVPNYYLLKDRNELMRIVNHDANDIKDSLETLKDDLRLEDVVLAQGFDDLDFLNSFPEYDFNNVFKDNLSRLVLSTMHEAILQIPGAKEWVIEDGSSRSKDKMLWQITGHPLVEKCGHTGMSVSWALSNLKAIYTNGWKFWVQQTLVARGIGICKLSFDQGVELHNEDTCIYWFKDWFNRVWPTDGKLSNQELGLSKIYHTNKEFCDMMNEKKFEKLLDMFLETFGMNISSKNYFDYLKITHEERENCLFSVYRKYWEMYYPEDVSVDCSSSKIDQREFLRELWHRLPDPLIKYNEDKKKKRNEENDNDALEPEEHDDSRTLAYKSLFRLEILKSNLRYEQKMKEPLVLTEEGIDEALNEKYGISELCRKYMHMIGGNKWHKVQTLYLDFEMEFGAVKDIYTKLTDPKPDSPCHKKPKKTSSCTNVVTKFLFGSK